MPLRTEDETPSLLPNSTGMESAASVPARSRPACPSALQQPLHCPAAAKQNAPLHGGSRRLAHAGKAIPTADLSPSAPEAITFSSLCPASPEPCLQERRRVTLPLRQQRGTRYPRPK